MPGTGIGYTYLSSSEKIWAIEHSQNFRGSPKIQKTDQTSEVWRGIGAVMLHVHAKNVNQDFEHWPSFNQSDELQAPAGTQTCLPWRLAIPSTTQPNSLERRFVCGMAIWTPTLFRCNVPSAPSKWQQNFP